MNNSSGRRILIVVGHLGLGGTQTIIAKIANEWVKHGHHIHIITWSDDIDDSVNLSPDISRSVLRKSTGKFTRVKNANKGRFGENQKSNKINIELDYRNRFSKNIFNSLNILLLILRLRSHIKKNRPEVVVAFLTPTNVITLLATIFTGVRTIISERNDPTRQPTHKIWKLLRRVLYNNAHVITANNKIALSFLSTFVNEEKLVFLPNPVDISSEISNLEQKKPHILVVGRLHPQKGLDILIRAFAQIYSCHKQWKLIVVGDGAQRKELKELSVKLGISTHVEWKGYLGDVTPYYKECSIFVQASRYEGMPNTVLEAMSYALPVIITDAQIGIVDIIENKISGIIVPVENIDELANNMELLIENSELRNKIGKKGWETIQIYDSGKIIPKWNDLVLNNVCC